MTGKGGKGLGKTGPRRHKKMLRDNIQGVTKGAIRRLARRGGVKRSSATIYDELRLVLREAVAVIESSGRKTVTVPDVVYVLNRLGNPIYGFGDSER
ncbi:histone H4 [Delphinella strobiligena]|nr:histone H4 [Delphinella strobiligena]